MTPRTRHNVRTGLSLLALLALVLTFTIWFGSLVIAS